MSFALDLKDIIYSDESLSNITSAVYARVSTRNEGQKDSCDNQVRTAQEFVSDHINLSLSEKNIFVDDGISGKSVTHRPGYQKMMEAVNNQEIKLIIVKTCSRLFRSVIEAQVFLNALILNSVVLLTLEDNRIWDFENQGDVMMFSLFSVFNANTSKVQSDAGIAAQKRRIKDKKLSAKDVVQGYIWNPETKKIEINPSTSKYIVNIFEEYVYRNGTPASICKMLKDNNITFPHNRRDPETKEHYVEQVFINERTISKIITNTKYIGLFPINQRGSKFIAGADSIRFVLPEEEWVIVERPDLQIIDKDLFELAQNIHKSRINIYETSDKKATQARFQGTHKYSGKIFCPLCGKPFHFGFADRKNTVPIYRIKNHSGCPNPVRRIHEQDLEELTKTALRQVIKQQEKVCASLEKVLIEIVNTSQNNGEEIKNLKKQKTIKEKKLDNLINQLSESGLTESAKKRVKDKINELTEETEKLTNIIADMENNKLDDSYVTERISEIKTAIDELSNFTDIDKARIKNYIERIEMHPNGDIDIELKTGQIIVAHQQDNNGFLRENNVGKKLNEDVRYS